MAKGSNSEFYTWDHWSNRSMRCTIIIHWKIQVVVFDFFIRVNIAIRKYLLHRKAGVKQIITTTLNRSKFFKSALSHNTVLSERYCGTIWKLPMSPHCVSIPFLTGFVVFRKIAQNVTALHQWHITWVMKRIKNSHNLNASEYENCRIKP